MTTFPSDAVTYESHMSYCDGQHDMAVSGCHTHTKATENARVYNVCDKLADGTDEAVDTVVYGDDALFTHVSKLILNAKISDDMADSIEVRSAMEALRKVARNFTVLPIGGDHAFLYLRDDTTVGMIRIFRVG